MDSFQIYHQGHYSHLDTELNIQESGSTGEGSAEKE